MQDAVDRPEERGPGLVVEDNDDTGGGQRRAVKKLPVHTPGERVGGISDELKVTQGLLHQHIGDECFQIFSVFIVVV